jgi:hypothetical protein
MESTAPVKVDKQKSPAENRGAFDLNIVMRFFVPSLADLAATYSSKP